MTITPVETNHYILLIIHVILKVKTAYLSTIYTFYIIIIQYNNYMYIYKNIF